MNSEFSLLNGMFPIWLMVLLLQLVLQLLTRALSLSVCGFNLATRAFSVLTCGFELVIQGFELKTRAFELATRGFELVTRRFELLTRGFEFVTRNLWIVFYFPTHCPLFRDKIFLPLGSLAERDYDPLKRNNEIKACLITLNTILYHVFL